MDRSKLHWSVITSGFILRSIRIWRRSIRNSSLFQRQIAYSVHCRARNYGMHAQSQLPNKHYTLKFSMRRWSWETYKITTKTYSTFLKLHNRCMGALDLDIILCHSHIHTPPVSSLFDSLLARWIHQPLWNIYFAQTRLLDYFSLFWIHVLARNTMQQQACCETIRLRTSHGHNMRN